MKIAILLLMVLTMITTRAFAYPIDKHRHCGGVFRRQEGISIYPIDFPEDAYTFEQKTKIVEQYYKNMFSERHPIKSKDKF